MNKNTEFDFSDHSRLSIREMTGQLFMPAAFINDSETEIQKLEELIRDFGPGGLCFFHSRASAATNFEGKKEIPYNAKSLDRLKELIDRYQRVSKIPLLIAMDAEWGLAMRVENTNQYPYALALGALPDDDPLIYQTGLCIAADLLDAGVHWNLAPVVDCNTNPDNPVIGYRSFGSRVHAVGKKATQIFRGMRDGGLLTCAKHFPGHGDTAIDSHLALPVLQKSISDLEREEFIPFQQLIEAGIPSVMTGHLAIPELDPTGTPASLSKPIIEQILRKQLNFKGLIITDALNMHAVSKRESQPGMTAYRAFEAGNDMLCFAEDIPEAIELILESDATNEISERCNRILKIKREVFDKNRILKVSDFTAKSLNEELAAHCLTNLGPGTFSSFPKAAPFALIDSGIPTQIFTEKIGQQVTPVASISWNWSSENMADFPIPETRRILMAIVPPSIKPPNRFGISETALKALTQTLETREVWVYLFGNPYSLHVLGLHSAAGVVVAYQQLPEFLSEAARHFLDDKQLTGILPFDF